MVKNVNIALDNEDYKEKIKRVKEDLGLTWEGSIIEAASCLDQHKLNR